MHDIDEDSITQAVIARHARAPDARVRDIMTSLVQHLHAFAREVKLTEGEWLQGIRFLADTGQLCSQQRQEFMLLSDLLGLSMLVTTMNQRRAAGCTESTVPGPFSFDAAPVDADHVQAQGAPGEPCDLCGRIRGRDGEPVPGAEIQVWQASAESRDDAPFARSARHRRTLVADAQGRYRFTSLVAHPHPVPTDGTGGRLLEALGRPAGRPTHLHVMVTAPGYRRLITQVFRRGDRHLDADPVFAVRRSLVADWVRHDAGSIPDGCTGAQPHDTLDFDFVLEKA